MTGYRARRVAYASPFVPPEWIASHALDPVRIWPSAASRGARAGICPYAWGWVEDVLQQPSWAGVVVTATCDQMRRSADAIAQLSDHALCLLHVPCKVSSSASVDYFGAELQRLGRVLVDWGGQAPTPDRLRDTMGQYDQQRRVLRTLRGQRSARDLCHAYRSQGTVPCAPPGETKSRPYRLGLVGSPLTWNALSLLEALEDADASLVFDATENGEGGLCAPFDRDRLSKTPFAELVQVYYESIHAINRRPNTAYFDWLQQQLATSRLHGLIVHRQPWCDLWHAELPRLRSLSPVPVLDLESSGMTSGREARLVTRIQAFVETLS